MVLFVDGGRGNRFSNPQGGQFCALVIVALFVAALLIDFQKPIKNQSLALRPENVGPVIGCDIHLNLIKHRRCRLTGHHALPDQGIEGVFLRTQLAAHAIWRAGYGGGADGFVGLLRVFGLAGIGAGRFGQIAFPHVFFNIGAGLTNGLPR